MIVEFSVQNYRSIKEKAVLNFELAKKFSKDLHLGNYSNIEPLNKNILHSMVIYGANASGKSNLLNAIKSLDVFVNSSVDFKIDDPIPVYDPFKLDENSTSKPTIFEIDFIAKDKNRYVYFVEFDKQQILKEELHIYGGEDLNRKNLLFSRDKNIILKFGSYYRGVRKFKIYKNQLIVSQVSKEPNDILLPVYRFFSKYLFCSTIHDTRYDDSLIEAFKGLLEQEESTFKRNVNRIIRAADTAIQEVITKEHDEKEFQFPNDMPEKVKSDILKKYKKRVKTVHHVFNANNEVVGSSEFEIEEESTGTIKLLVIGGLIIDALSDGTTLLVDELDKSLHPLLTKMLIYLFHNPETNPNGAQLLLATHDVTLLDKEVFRLDQVMFTDKKLNGSSNYTKLSEYTGLSKLAEIASWYLLGRFGGTPMIDEYELDLEIETI